MSAKSKQIVAKMWAFISPCAFSTAVLHMQALKAWQSPKILAHKWGDGGGPPLGGVQWNWTQVLLLGALGRFLGSSWALFKCSWGLQGQILDPSNLPSLHLGGSGDVPGWIFEGFRDFLHNVFMAVVTAHLHLLTLFVYPFWCGGLCFEAQHDQHNYHAD